MAALTPLSFSPVTHSTRPNSLSSFSSFSSTFPTSFHYNVAVKSSISASRMLLHCMSTSTEVPPTVSETKRNFLKAYKKPIPSIYNTVLQELIVQQHLMRYKRTYQYDAVFALGFVTVYDQLMQGYPGDEDRDAIFQAYIKALKEEPEQYRADAKKLEEWARAQTASSLVEFQSRQGEIEGILKDIAARAANGSFSYSRFFAVGLFRLLELSNATEPTVLEKLCAALNISKRSVDRDLDVYRNLLSKLVQAKELLKEYMDREKKKQEERAESQKANEAVKQCLSQPQYNYRNEDLYIHQFRLSHIALDGIDHNFFYSDFDFLNEYSTFTFFKYTNNYTHSRSEDDPLHLQSDQGTHATPQEHDANFN